MRRAYTHDALLAMAADADLAGPGGAVTLALCGAFDHAPPCPVAPHATRSDRNCDRSGHDASDQTNVVAVRVLFAADPAREDEVRARIDAALAGGSCTGPDGTRTEWTFLSSAPGVVAESERAHAGRLIDS